MGLLGHQDNDTLLARLDQTALGSGGQGIIKVGQQGLVVEAPFQLGTHKEAAILVIHKLIVLDDVELVADVGDLGDEPFGIRAIGQQYFLFHLCHFPFVVLALLSAPAALFRLSFRALFFVSGTMP